VRSSRGIGRRLDGCAERDLDVEKIIALARDIVEYLKSL
jgi:hypothetical protein